MDVSSFYERPMVRRMTEIFNHPKPPAHITETQFDRCQEELEAIARTPWHELHACNLVYYLEGCAGARRNP